MRSSMMTRGFRTYSLFAVAGAAVLVFHSAAQAQQTKPDAKDAEKATVEATDADKAKPEPAAEPGAKPAPQQDELPPEYAPPPGYRRGPAPPPQGYGQPGYGQPGYGPHYDYYYGAPPYPPPRYYRPRYYPQPGPVRYYPEPITYRPFFFGIGLGIGGVAFFPESDAGENSSRAGISYNLHFGFGVSPHWSIVLSGDGAYAYFNGYNVGQSVWSIGPQFFINRHLYVRGGIGVATKSVENDSYWGDYYATYDSYSDSGMGWTLAIGWEFMQSYHASLGLEAAATYGRYKDPDPITGSRDQGTAGINFMLRLF
jgi:hypothetical protein